MKMPPKVGNGDELPDYSSEGSLEAANLQDFLKGHFYQIATKIDGLTSALDRIEASSKESTKQLKRAGTNMSFKRSMTNHTICSKVTSKASVVVAREASKRSARSIRSVVSRRTAKKSETSSEGRAPGGMHPRAPTRQSKRGLRIQRSTTSLTERFGTRIENLAELSGFIMCHENRTDSPEQHWKVAIWEFLENSLSSHSAWCYSQFMSAFILLSVLASMFELMPFSANSNSFFSDGAFGLYFHLVFEIAFSAELALRFLSCPNRGRFLTNMFNIIDLMSLLPLIVRTVLLAFKLHDPGADVSVLLLILCVAPTLRLMKFLRRFDKLHLLISAFESAAEALPVLLFLSLLIALVFSTIFYAVEELTYPSAFWLTIITMSTVGYGDAVAASVYGRATTTALIVISQLYLAIPIAIVGVAFTDVWRDRNRLLLMQRLRESVARAGYTADQVFKMFELIDGDGDGELTIEEFCIWLREHRNRGVPECALPADA